MSSSLNGAASSSDVNIVSELLKQVQALTAQVAQMQRTALAAPPAPSAPLPPAPARPPAAARIAEADHDGMPPPDLGAAAAYFAKYQYYPAVVPLKPGPAPVAYNADGTVKKRGPDNVAPEKQKAHFMAYTGITKAELSRYQYSMVRILQEILEDESPTLPRKKVWQLQSDVVKQQVRGMWDNRRGPLYA
jgi:hypothetical protein